MSDSSGYYRFDMTSLSGGCQTGDTVNATAYAPTAIGWNETIISYAPHLWLNVTIGGIIIPEFSDFALPIVGMLSMFGVVIAISRSNHKKRP